MAPGHNPREAGILQGYGGVNGASFKFAAPFKWGALQHCLGLPRPSLILLITSPPGVNLPLPR